LLPRPGGAADPKQRYEVDLARRQARHVVHRDYHAAARGQVKPRGYRRIRLGGITFQKRYDKELIIAGGNRSTAFFPQNRLDLV
jgi:hypothetical protein